MITARVTVSESYGPLPPVGEERTSVLRLGVQGTQGSPIGDAVIQLPNGSSINIMKVQVGDQEFGFRRETNGGTNFIKVIWNEKKFITQ